MNERMNERALVLICLVWFDLMQFDLAKIVSIILKWQWR